MLAFLQLIKSGAFNGAVLITEGDTDADRLAIEVLGVAHQTHPKNATLTQVRLILGRVKAFNAQLRKWMEIPWKGRWEFELDPRFPYSNPLTTQRLILLRNDMTMLPIYRMGDPQPVSVPVSFTDNPLDVGIQATETLTNVAAT